MHDVSLGEFVNETPESNSSQLLSTYIDLIGGYHSYVLFYYENDDGGVDFEIKTVLDDPDIDSDNQVADSMEFLTDESYGVYLIEVYNLC